MIDMMFRALALLLGYEVEQRPRCKTKGCKRYGSHLSPWCVEHTPDDLSDW